MKQKKERGTHKSLVGFLFLCGKGVEQNDSEAVCGLKRPRKLVMQMGKNNLGIMYLNGRGIAHDFVVAKSWFEKAAKQNDANAQNNLGLMYANGQGVPVDLDAPINGFAWQPIREIKM